MTDDKLYLRGARTLLASWERYAAGSTGAAVQRLSGVSAAASPNDTERAFYNNAWLDRYRVFWDDTLAALAAYVEDEP